MGKNKKGGKKANVFKVAGAKSLKAKTKAKPVTGNLKKINEIVRKNIDKIDKNLVQLQKDIREKKQGEGNSKSNEKKKGKKTKGAEDLEKEKLETFEKLNEMQFFGEMEDELKKAGIIVIGDEILKGHVKDSNSIFLCKRFHAIGVKVCRISTIGDDAADIAEEVARFSERFDIVITTGGIGPTHDDITYEAIAKALDDKIVLHSEMAEVIRSYFQGTTELETNPALKMALIPQKSKLIYVPPKPEKGYPATEKHNGLQVKRYQTEKKPFPVVQVKNIYVLPGMMEWLEHAFNHLQKVFENPAVNIYTMILFLKASEVKIVKELNHIVNKFQNQVIFGSYATDSLNEEFQTKITMESTTLDDVTAAHSYLKSTLPKEFLSSELHGCDADLVYELTNGTKSLSLALRNSLKVIEEAFKEYDSDEIYVSFNGGKDCTVLLHLVWTVSKNKNRMNTLYIKSDVGFPEVDDFISKTSARYNLNLVTAFGSIKAALGELHKQDQSLKAIFMGTRRTDPHSADLQEFQTCDQGWPSLMRVNPILDWSYDNVWEFLRILDVPYCRLYDEGYTSIGSPRNTQPNPALKIPGSHNKYLPAFRLKDGSLERQGRK